MVARKPPRPPRRATSVADLSHVGLRLFIERGFDETTVDDIAAAAGIGRRTFFRYFASKNDLPWGDFEALVERMRACLKETPDDVPTIAALRRAVIEFNTYPAGELGYHRKRMRLLLNVPTLLAHSNLRYESWRVAIAEFVARRLGVPVTDRRPQVVAWTFLAVSLAAYQQWLRDEQSDLIDLIVAALGDLEFMFGGTSA
jgi:TetR/AcrR family transcriptional regulator, regulator of mycofactocin system